MNQPDQRIYRLDGVEIDASRLRVTGGKRTAPQAENFQVLIYLLEQRERLVTKDELIQHIWPQTAVTDNALDQCLAEIRKVLGDDSRQPRFIKTVPRAGYRFIGAVRERRERTGQLQLTEADAASRRRAQICKPELPSTAFRCRPGDRFWFWGTVGNRGNGDRRRI
jgi:DNA-binding winged helix-turn-helix (wHTH) protein